ncbi:MAG: Gmad2 immunoglobulin-like domain-containing protein [Patescibacteria group bacterium]
MRNKIFGGLIILLIVFAVILRLFPAKRVILPTPPVEPLPPVVVDPVPPPLSDLIKVNYPKPNDVIKSPVSISGEARGTWFFEASFPITILDANRKVLAKVPMQATADWMTIDFVPFEGVVPFVKSTTTTGFIIFENDNPSGEVERSKSIEVPIRFE